MSEIHTGKGIADAVTYVSAGGSIALGLTASELAALGGLVIAALAYITNAGLTWWFKYQHLKLARKQARADEDE